MCRCLPYQSAAAVTTSDSNPNGFNAFIVTVGGTVKITDSVGGTATITATAGVIYPIKTKLIWATGTAATGIVGLT